MSDDASARLYQALVNQDAAAAISVIEQVRGASSDTGTLFEALFAPAMSLLGGAWAAGTIDEYTFTQAAVVAEQIGSFVMPSSTAQDTGVTVLLGTMHRDHHSIDRNIITAALKEAGHREEHDRSRAQRRRLSCRRPWHRCPSCRVPGAT